jgi:hypothetical protein
VAKKTTAAKASDSAKAASLITWRKLPKGVQISAHGPKSAELDRLMKKAGLNPRAECYGGDTCIV